jgi:hypothetical protein
MLITIWAAMVLTAACGDTSPSTLSEDDAELVARTVLDEELRLGGMPDEFSVGDESLSSGHFVTVESNFLGDATEVRRPASVANTQIDGDGRDLWRFLLRASNVDPAPDRTIHALIVIDDRTAVPALVEIFGSLAAYDGSLGRLSPSVLVASSEHDGAVVSMSMWMSPGGWCWDLADTRHPQLAPGDVSACGLSFADVRTGPPLLLQSQTWEGFHIAAALVDEAVTSVRFVPDSGAPVVVWVTAATGIAAFPRRVAMLITTLPQHVTRVEALGRESEVLASQAVQ